jgi:hypothetical protein
MAADLRPVQSYINLDALKSESSDAVRLANVTADGIVAAFKKTKGIELNLRSDPSGIKAVRLAIEELAKTQKKLEKSVVDLNRIRTEELKQQVQLEKLSQQRLKTQQQEAKTNDQVAKSKERSAKAAKVEADAVIKASNAYEQLKRRYEIAANTAKRLGAEQGILSQEFLESSAQAQKLYKELIALEKAVGQNQRQVGAYEKGFAGLQNSFNQISRELPAFANSVQTGFLAISNNLPIFFDEISKSRKEIAALRAEGKETQGLLSRLGSAFFSLGTFLSIAVTLLTVFGDEIVNFVAALFKGTKALDQFIERQRILQEAFKSSEFIDSIKNVKELAFNIQLAKEGLLDKDDVLKQYNETLGKTTGQVSSLDEAEKELTKNGDAYVKMMLYKAAANLALEESAKKLAEAERTRQQRDRDFQTLSTNAGTVSSTVSTAPGFVPGTSDPIAAAAARQKAAAAARQKEVDRLKKESDIELNIFEEFQRKAAQISKDNNFSFFDTDKLKKDGEKLKAVQQVFNVALLKDIQERNKKISEEEGLFQSLRLEARQRASEAEIAIINGLADTELANERATMALVLSDKKASNIEKLNAGVEYRNAERDIEAKRADDLLEANRKFEFDVIAIKLQSRKRQLEIKREQLAEDLRLGREAGLGKSQADILQEETEKIKVALERRSDFLKEDADNRLRRVEENFQKEFEVVKNNPTKLAQLEEATALKRLQIQNETNAFLLKAELDYAAAYLDILKSLGFDTVDQEAKIAELRKKIAETETKTKEDNAKKQIAIEEQKNAKLAELASAGTSLISSVVQGVFDRRKNEIQDEIDALEKKKQKDIEVANQTITNEQDRAAAIQTINVRAQAQKEQLEQRQRKVDQERARFERLKSIVDIVQNTAIAITAQTKGLPATAPIIALIGAIGAAQIAAVLARPIPKYADGTDDHPGGLAVVGDGGKNEMVVTPDGKLILTPKVPTLMDLPEHSIVLPDASKASEVLARQAVMDSIRYDRLDRTAAPNTEDRIQRQMLATLKRIEQKPVTQPYIKNGDIRRMVYNGQTWTDYLNSNL